MAKNLVIVESPAKARTLGRFLGRGYRVLASLGHVRDLPQNRLGVNIEKGFSPYYQVLAGKRKVVQEIKGAAEGADSIYLATDPDREGEAISWHIVQAARLDGKPLHRVVFHEITPEAVKEAFRHPRSIDMRLVDAQQTRRILDRLVGYKLSPVLWSKVRKGLSAGRVQSVALRLVVEREREIEAFTPREYWAIEARLAKKDTGQEFTALLLSKDGERLEPQSQAEAEGLVAALEGADYKVASVKKKESSRRPAPPFITSTLQQEAWRKLHFSAKRTMAIAQQLYEGLPLGQEGPVGLITYMRTDSVRVASSALAEARAYIKDKYGLAYLPPSPRAFTRKVVGAQEAHEAIRPTSIYREPEAIASCLSPEQARLYTLVWKRMVASQMASATLENTTADIEARAKRRRYLFRASSTTVRFPGFLALYSEGRDDEDSEESKAPLPHLKPGEGLDCLSLKPEQHFTQPPPRYTEASLVRALEEKGIGRPSTYAPILAALQERGYVERRNGRLHPLSLGMVVTDLLAEHFGSVINLGFTAQMEEKLDCIARGELEGVPVLGEFYQPLDRAVKEGFKRIGSLKPAPQPTGESCPECGRPLVMRTGRYGSFTACSGFPECRYTKSLAIRAGTCPQCGGDLVQRRSKKGRTFYGCARYPQCTFATSQRPLPEPCPECGGTMVASGRAGAHCLKCSYKVSKPEEAAEL